jgi:hypothetical protein
MAEGRPRPPIPHIEIHAEAPDDPRQPFILAQAPEWRWTRDPDMMTSPDRIAAGADAEEMCVISSEWTLQNLKDGDEAGYGRLIGALGRDEKGGFIMGPNSQPPGKALKFGTYRHLHRGLMDAMPDQESYEAMAYIMLIHDIGKNPELMRAVGLDPEQGANHDEAVGRLFSDEYAEQRRRFLPTYEADNIFSERTKELISGVMLLPVNWGGLAQSQCSSAELDKIPEDTDPQVKKMSYWHWVLDAGGVLGHKNPQAALMLSEPNAQTMLKAESAFLWSNEELGLEPDFPLDNFMRTDLYLAMRGESLGVDFYRLIARAHDTDLIMAVDTKIHQEINALIQESPDRLKEGVDEILHRNPMPFIEYGFMKTKIMLADMQRYNTEPEYQTIEQDFDRLPLLSRIMLMNIIAPGRDESISFDWDYAPGLLRNLSNLPPQEGAQSALSFLLNVMDKASAAPMEARLKGQLEGKDVQEHEYIVALRDLAIAAGKPGFSMETALRMTVHEGTVHVTLDDTGNEEQRDT